MNTVLVNRTSIGLQDWPGRWKESPATSGSRGRADKRSCRGCSASRSSGDRGRTKCDTSAICTPSRQCPFGNRSSEIASSKSRASTGSIVMTVSRGQIESRPRGSLRRIGRPGRGHRPARRRRNAPGRLNSRMIDSVSTPGSPRAAEHFGDHAFAVVHVRRESGSSRTRLCRRAGHFSRPDRPAAPAG